MKTLAKDFDDSIQKAFSGFAVLLNSVSQAHWLAFESASQVICKLSGKSKLPSLESPALLFLGARALFGVGARADVITFFLMQPKGNYSAADLVEIGYSKRNLADILEGFVQTSIFTKTTVRNQRRYSCLKYNELEKLIGKLPKFNPKWRLLLRILLTIRVCIEESKKKSESTLLIELRNALHDLSEPLTQLRLTPPQLQPDFQN